MSVVDKDGVYDDLTDAEYHADPVPGGSLSSSGARLLLPPGCPARFRWEREHGRQPSAAFDLGHVAHRLLLGVGAELVVVDADDWRTKAAREARAVAYADGATPILRHQHEQAQAMVDQLRRHPIAGELFDPQLMLFELSLVWTDLPTGVCRRARLDAISRPGVAQPAVIVDYKTTSAADLDHVARAVHRYGYHQQAAWYLDGVQALGLDPGRFLFAFQETAAPYLVTIVELDDMALAVGRQRNRQAIELYAECTAHDTWPAHADGIEPIRLPPWAEREYDMEEIDL